MAPGLAPWTAAGLIPAAVGYALIVTLPAALIFRELGWVGPMRAVMAGLITVGAPIVLLALLTGSLGEAIVYLALSGVGGLAAWLLARLQAVTDLWTRGRLHILGGTAFSLTVLAVTLSLAAWGSSAVYGPKDLSCHNLGRYEARSFPVRQAVTIRFGEQDWPRFRMVMSEIATRDGWSLRDDTRDDSLGMSLCQEIGTRLTVQQWVWSDPPWPAAALHVVAPQGGEAWRPTVDEVLVRLEKEWPGAVDRNAEVGFPHVGSRAVAPAPPPGNAGSASHAP